MALKVLPAEVLQELLVSIRRSVAVLKERVVNHTLIGLILDLLSRIKLAGTQDLKPIVVNQLDEYEAEMQELLARCKRCQCAECQKNRPEAAA